MENIKEVAKQFVKNIANVVYSKPNGMLKMEHLEDAFIAGYEHFENNFEDDLTCLHSLIDTNFKNGLKVKQWMETDKKKMYSKETLLDILNFIIGNANIEEGDLFINNQLLNAEQLLTEYSNRTKNLPNTTK